MSHLLLLALIPPFLFSTSVFIDKFLIEKYCKLGGIGSLIIFSCLIGTILLPVVFFLSPAVLTIAPLYALLMMLGGILYMISLFPYIYALFHDEASIVAPLFQIIPIF